MSEPQSNPPNASTSLADLSRSLEGINQVANAEQQAATEPDHLALLGEEDLAKESIRAQIAQLQEDVNQTKRVNLFRLRMLIALFVVIMLWILSVIILTAFLGFKVKGFNVSDAVMITYITTTTASVFGLFLIAAKWLYRG